VPCFVGRRVGDIGLAAIERERGGTHRAPAFLHYGEGREEVADLRLLHLEADLIAVDFSSPLEVRDAVAVDDDATDRQVVGAENGLARTAEHERSAAERAEDGGREVASVLAVGTAWGAAAWL